MIRASGWAASILIAFSPAFARGAQSVEVLSVSGVSVTFEKTGDDSQISEFKSQIVPKVKSILESISQSIGLEESPKQARLFFFSAESYAAKFPQQAETKTPAFYTGGAVYARADNSVDDQMERTLQHELTHLLLDLNFSHVPAWMNEGLAEYHERLVTFDPAPNNIDYNTLHIGKQNSTYIPLRALESRSYFARDHGTVAAGMAYTTAYVAVYELVQKNGMDAVRSFLKTLEKNNDVAAAFVSAFGMEYGKFDTYLQETSEKKS